MKYKHGACRFPNGQLLPCVASILQCNIPGQQYTTTHPAMQHTHLFASAPTEARTATLNCLLYYNVLYFVLYCVQWEENSIKDAMYYSQYTQGHGEGGRGACESYSWLGLRHPLPAQNEQKNGGVNRVGSLAQCPDTREISPLYSKCSSLTVISGNLSP